MTPFIVSIQVGKPRTHDPDGKPWDSAIVKVAVEGALWLGTTNLAGDAQADLKNHGGPDKAVLAYGAERYDHWRRDLPDLAWSHGGFGENLTIAGQDEESVCIGDIYTTGSARVEVSQPRQPCWKLARRWDQKDLTARVHENGFSGWYLRVLDVGEIAPGMTVELVERPYPEMTVMRATRIMQDDADVEGARALLAIPVLAASWQEALARRVGG